MLLLDITIVNVALPSIQHRLKADLTGLQWVVDAYALALAALILTAGALADRFGRRLLFTFGVIVFTSASLLCGLAWNITALNVARGLQGVGGAALFATALALIGHEYRGADRFGAIAVWLAPLSRDPIIRQNGDDGALRPSSFIWKVRTRTPQRIGVPAPRRLEDLAFVMSRAEREAGLLHDLI